MQVRDFPASFWIQILDHYGQPHGRAPVRRHCRRPLRRATDALAALCHLLLGSERAPPVCSAATSFSASTDGSRFLCPRPRPLVPICCRRPACSAPSDHRIFDDSEALFWPMRAASGTGDVAGASCSTGQRLRRRRAALHGCGMGTGWDHPAASRCRCRLGVHVASRRPAAACVPTVRFWQTCVCATAVRSSCRGASA